MDLEKPIILRKPFKNKDEISLLNLLSVFDLSTFPLTFLIYIYGSFNKFPDFFVQAFKIVIDSWKFTMLLLYIL